jgi:monovalent cation/hydrogen antiporter
VTIGLIVGNRSPGLSTAASRLRGYAFWEVLVFLLNALLFVLVGLQLPGILADQERSAGELAGLALLVSLVVIVSRLVWINTVPYVIRALDRRPSQIARRVGWRQRLVVGWSGLRGAVSLAAALALPTDFPERDLLIFLTLAVIFATLVVQGLTLPPLIRLLDVHDDGQGEREELHARKAAAQAAIEHLRALEGSDGVRPDTLERMIGLYEFRHRRLAQRAAAFHGRERNDDDEDLDQRSRTYQAMVRGVLDVQRRRVVELRDDGTISDEVMHALERELDLEDQRLEI